MYRGYEILSEAAFRVTRNSNLYLREEESRNLMESVRTEFHTAARAMRCDSRLRPTPIPR